MNEKIRQYQLRLFNKLFSTLPTVKKMNEDKAILNLDKPITHYYSFRNKNFWFCKGETEDKFEGANVFVYCYKATDEEKITDEEMLALFLPVLLVILAVIALFVSINFGISAMRRLDFNNEATEFKN